MVRSGITLIVIGLLLPVLAFLVLLLGLAGIAAMVKMVAYLLGAVLLFAGLMMVLVGGRRDPAGSSLPAAKPITVSEPSRPR